MKLIYKITDNKYENIKQILKQEFNMSERLILRLKTNNKIFINDNPVSIYTSFSINDIISVILDFEEDNSNIVPKEMDLHIIYEDEYYLVIDKPAGIAIHPSILHYDNSLSNGIRFYFDKIGLKKKIRPVNRLDKDTSGIVVFAKNQYIQECLVKQMKQNTFEKEYVAMLSGILEEKSGTINAPIARKGDSIIERCVKKDGDVAITHYEVISEFDNMSYVKFKLETGRTHQIRVHSRYIGHPIIR